MTVDRDDARDPAADPPKRLAFVITRSDSVGGAQVCVQGLAEGMRDAGHRVRVFVGAPPGVEAPFVDRMRDAGLDVETLPQLVREIRPGTDLRGLLQLRAALARFDPDLVSAHSTKAGWLARAAAKSLGKPAIFTAHGWLFGPGPLRGRAWVARHAEWVTAPLADAVVTVSEWDRNAALAHGVVHPDKMVTVYNAVPDLPLALRADPKGEPPRLVAVARLEEPKDPLTLLEAAALVRQRLGERGWTLDLIGDGPLRPKVEARLAALDLGERVRLLGTRDDVPAQLAAAQVFILPSRHEGFPISILEAMRAGLPVVSSDVGGVSEALGRAGDRGRLVTPGDPAALADALTELITDPELRARLGAAARADYEARFTFEQHLHRTWAVYRSVL
ncbi:MAG: glycosyltransferase family 4 protein [Myxococcales bacterium]|nr:glycosyltransferase family 4 protein [Myxococcales bacterium]